jgi:hypothetical protein
MSGSCKYAVVISHFYNNCFVKLSETKYLDLHVQPHVP